MIKTFLISTIFILILITSIVKNSTKNIEDEVFSTIERLKSLKNQMGKVLLEYNYLSSPEKLLNFYNNYFKNDLSQKDIQEIKRIYKNDGQIVIEKFILETDYEQGK